MQKLKTEEKFKNLHRDKKPTSTKPYLKIMYRIVYYIEISQIRNKNHKINPCFVSPGLRSFRAKQTLLIY